MNQPPDDPFSHASTENAGYPPRPRPGGAPGYSQQPSSPGYPSQGPASQPGFAPQSNSPAQRPPSQPGFSPQDNARVQRPISQPGFSPQGNSPTQGPPSQPGFSSQNNRSTQEPVRQLDFPPLDKPFAQGPVSQPGFSPQSKPFAQGPASQPGFALQNNQQQASAPVSAGQRPSSPGNPASSPGLVGSPEQTTRNASSRDDSASLQVQELPTVPLATVNVPPPSNPRSPKKAQKKSGVLVSIVVVLALIIAGGGTFFALHLRNTVQTRNTPTAQATPTAPASVTPVEASSGTLNQPLQAGLNWVVTVTHVTTTTTSDFPPQAGYTYLEITLSLKNTSATPQIVASLLQFTFSDASGKKYDEAAAITKDTNIHQTPDGTINAGQTLNAQLSYLVPQAQHTFVLSFSYDLIDGGSSVVTWSLTV